jgi:hypothetical protein
MLMPSGAGRYLLATLARRVAMLPGRGCKVIVSGIGLLDRCTQQLRREA